jgi:hypothetical protein
MTSAKDVEEALSGHEFTPELRRGCIMHGVEDHPAGMLHGTVNQTNKDDLIPPHLARQNLVIPAYPYRAALPRRIKH